MTPENHRLRDQIQEETVLRDASFDEMEKNEEMHCRVKQSQRDAERMRLEDETQDRAP